MSKGEKPQEMQEEINSLKAELKRKDELILQFQKRLKPEIQDFLKPSGEKKT